MASGEVEKMKRNMESKLDWGSGGGWLDWENCGCPLGGKHGMIFLETLTHGTARH